MGLGWGSRVLSIPGDRPTEVGISLLKQTDRIDVRDGTLEGAKYNGLSVLTDQPSPLTLPGQAAALSSGDWAPGSCEP